MIIVRMEVNMVVVVVMMKMLIHDDLNLPLGHPVRNTLYCYGGSIVDYDDEDVKDDNSDRGMDR